MSKSTAYPNPKWPKLVKEKWDLFNAKYLLADPYGQECLTSFCDGKALEIAGQALVDRDGLVIKDAKGKIVEHPALATIRGARAQQRLALRALHLDEEPKNPVGRPPSSSR